jgi:hypothetical protein
MQCVMSRTSGKTAVTRPTVAQDSVVTASAKSNRRRITVDAQATEGDGGDRCGSRMHAAAAQEAIRLDPPRPGSSGRFRFTTEGWQPCIDGVLKACVTKRGRSASRGA